MNSLYVFLTGRRVTASVESQVRLEAVAAALAAEAGLLVAAERRRRVEPVVRVGPDDPRAQALGHPENPRALLRPDAGAEPVRRVVRLLERFLGRAERQDREHRTEDLLLRDPVALCDVREDGRDEPVALLRQAAGRLVDLRALLLAGRNELLDLLELLLGVDRADVGVLVQRISDSQRGEPALELLDHRLVDRLLYEQARARTAHVALIEVDPVDDPLDRLVESGVVENDIRGLAAELQRQLLARACELALDRLANLCRTGERDLVHALGLHDRGAGAAVTGDDVDDARGKLRLAQHVAEQEGAQRRRFRGLQHDGVPRGKGRRDLPCQHQEREVPRNDLAGDADRTRAPVRECVLELVRPARVVEEMRRRQRKIDVTRFLDRLAAVQGLEDGELARALLEDPRNPEQVLRPLGRRDVRPTVLERVARGADGPLDFLGRRLPDLPARLLGRGADRRVRLGRLEPLAADEVPVPLFEADDVARLRSRRIRPVLRDRRAFLLSLELSQAWSSPG